MADQTFSLTQLAATAAATLITGGALTEAAKRVFGWRKERAEVALLTAQAQQVAAQTLLPEERTLKMLMGSLEAIQKNSAEREAAAVEREHHAETREALLRAQIKDLEAKLEDLSVKLEQEQVERKKLQRMFTEACYSCKTWRGAAADESEIFSA